jgi:hypothetical protein
VNCPVCGSDDYPHSHNLGVLYNTTRGRYAAPSRPLRKWLPYAAAALVLFAVLAWAVT